MEGQTLDRVGQFSETHPIRLDCFEAFGFIVSERSRWRRSTAVVHSLDMGKVTGSIPVVSTILDERAGPLPADGAPQSRFTP